MRSSPRAKPRRALVACGAAAAIATSVIAVIADNATNRAPIRAQTVPLTEESLPKIVAAGRSWRLEFASGIVHVWIPATYHPDGAATILYVHGYYVDVDQAWTDHRLPEQFALSSMNAVFIAPEAPSGLRQSIQWPSLGDLLVDVFGAIGLPRPMGPVVAIGHSGAFRTLIAWMDFPGLDVLVAMDAMYGEVETWRDWLDASPSHRLIVVGDDTTRWTEELVRDLGDAVVTLDRFPDLEVDEPPAIGDARVAYIRSQYGHMPLITGGVGLPLVLRLLPISILPGGPWHLPLGLPAVDAGIVNRP